MLKTAGSGPKKQQTELGMGKGKTHVDADVNALIRGNLCSTSVTVVTGVTRTRVSITPTLQEETGD